MQYPIHKQTSELTIKKWNQKHEWSSELSGKHAIAFAYNSLSPPNLEAFIMASQTMFLRVSGELKMGVT